ncbi:unnamed protein product [Gongylonema pulchrum]|uniref:PAP_RNA-bind domain-containing protein n=1 Tax=Gongylonema pulchrum TaxID=637853 RepID=A0A183E8H1_9BILA|nr:unnamed protein product [Gongylonema pulchrum]
MTWNEAALQFYMHMNGTSWLFPIGASIPRHMLAKCHSALPRPPFESLIFCFVCVIACAYLEGDRTVTCALRQQYSQMGQIFDLNVMNRRLLHENDDDGGDDNDDCVTTTSTSSSEIKPSSPRRHVLHYSSDSNLLVRSFWQTADNVLWLFSFIWQFRGDEKNLADYVAVIAIRNRKLSSVQEDLWLHFKTVDSLGDPDNYTLIRYHFQASLPIKPTKARQTRTLRLIRVTALQTPWLNDMAIRGLNRLRSGTAPEASGKNSSIPNYNNSNYGKKRGLTGSETADIATSRTARRPVQDYVTVSAAAVQTTPTIEKGGHWLSVHREKAVDERSETALSETSGNVDDDFTALADATERFFEQELKPPAQRIPPATRPPPVTIKHDDQINKMRSRLDQLVSV